ncbi:maleate cis-trans isomerase family protein [Saccharomonospora piscinae]|uniref:Maleate cis-trans isomerase n=1 Tax=Saccharomonospora piscinae TaxID=687388 RepID=A0A1V9A5K0_SACPI|nr:maleate cis-trans isomerase [Saccharomonospora piscinae]OQO92320.1 maleate cis-trans isomerase [Saccharomonospora piscinae]TLW91972.1 maleate cis-trans isomerase [Saccharomonospora piscinae]
MSPTQQDEAVTVGFIYPDHAAEDDYPYAEKLLSGTARLAVEHIYGTDLHAVAELLDLGSPARLAEGATQLAAHEPDAVVWACTSGSFVYGWDGAHEQVASLSAAAAGLPASSTSFAFVRAARALGVRTVAVAASYPDDVAELFVEFLGRGGVEVVGMSSADIVTAAEVGRLSTDEVVDLVVSRDRPDADALLVPDTAMRTLALLDPLEQRLGKPVLTANQVTVWEGLRLAGVTAAVPGLGTLFREKGD